MGQYIVIGVATTIYVTVTQEKSFGYSYTVEQVKEILSKEINLDLYDEEIYKNYLILYLKKDVFKENIIKLLQSECKYFKREKFSKEILEKIRKTPKDELIESIENRKFNEDNLFFAKFGMYSNDISYSSGKEYVEMWADLFAYHIEGKAILETYNELFYYLRKKIIENIDNPLKDDVFISLYG